MKSPFAPIREGQQFLTLIFESKEPFLQAFFHIELESISAVLLSVLQRELIQVPFLHCFACGLTTFLIWSALEEVFMPDIQLLSFQAKFYE
jgi:hypothetical protein